MEQEVVLDVKVKNQTLKQQLREAVKEAQALQEQFGETSKEAINAAKKVANIKEQISDMNDVFKAFHPESKFNAVIGVTQGIAGGFQSLTGAMALFGTQSEAVEKTLLKVQAATAFAEGLNSIKGLGDAFNNLKLVGVNAFNALKGAIGSTGIGLLVVAIGVAINEYIKWSNEISQTEKNQEQLNKKLKKQSDLIDEINKKNKERRDFESEYLKAQGVSEDAITAKRISNLLEEQKENTKAYKAKEELFLKQRELTQYYFKQGNKDKQEESAKEEKRLQDELKKLIENKKNINNQIDLIDANYNTQQEKLQKQRDLEAEKKRKEREAKKAADLAAAKKTIAETNAKDFKDSEEEMRKAEESLKKMTDEFQTKQAEGLEKAYEQRKSRDEQIKKDQEKFAEDEIRIEKEKQDKKLAIQNEAFNSAQSLLNSLSGINDLNKQKELEQAKGSKEKIAAIEKKYFERNKKFQIAQTVMATAQAAMNAFASASKLSPIAGAIAAAAAIAAGAVQIAKIKATKFDSGGGDSGESTSPTPTPSANDTAGGVQGMQAPQQVGQGIANANAINNAMNNPNMIRAVVVETDITDSQRRVRGIEERATFG